MKLLPYLTLTLILSTVALGGCAQVVTKNYGKAKGGTVKYSSGMLASKNREKALDLAKEYCSPGRPILTSESNKKEFTGRTTTRGNSKRNVLGSQSYQESYQESSEVVYINFRCGSGSKSRVAKNKTNSKTS